MGAFVLGVLCGVSALVVFLLWATSGPVRLSVWTLEKYDEFAEMWDVAGVYGSEIKAREDGNDTDSIHKAVRCWEVRL